MKQETEQKLVNAIKTLSKYSGKQLNDDIPQYYCDVIWDLIEFAQFHLRQSDFNKELMKCKCEDKTTNYHLLNCVSKVA